MPWVLADLVLEEIDSDHLVAAAFVAPSTLGGTQARATPGFSSIHLEEDKLFVQLGGDGLGDSTRWILDTGATNHMTGVRSAFAELDTGVHGTVRFGDGSVVGIEGRGTVLYSCKDGEHQKLQGRS